MKREYVYQFISYLIMITLQKLSTLEWNIRIILNLANWHIIQLLPWRKKWEMA